MTGVVPVQELPENQDPDTAYNYIETTGKREPLAGAPKKAEKKAEPAKDEHKARPWQDVKKAAPVAKEKKEDAPGTRK